MALPFIGGPLNGKNVTRDMSIAWDFDRSGLVWHERVVEDEPVFSLDTSMPTRGSYSLINHRYILKCRGEFLISNCWLEYAGVVS